MSEPDLIAHYRISAKLGEGGMGAVYRATDTRLNRDVAVKVLPPAFAADAGRLARFTREAQLLASLNHPHIASIYGVEEGALVLELVEGPTLAERIEQGPIALDEALAIAGQIAAALDYAHEKGIVHRDLKPANIKLTGDGRVKVLDFGLAKAVGAETPMSDPAVSPTLTIGGTAVGAILGTAGYMSPEQARGKVVDKRADIWAFGVVLYEMLTGRHLYESETVSDTLAGVLVRDPDLSVLPQKVRRLIGLCLQKDARKRLRDIGDFAALLEEAPAAPRSTASIYWLVAGWAATAAIALGLLAWIWLHPAPLPEVTRFQILAPPGSILPLSTPAPSPDGRKLAYLVRDHDGVTRIYLRSFDSTESRALPGTERAVHPFWSPDGRSLAFATIGQIKRIDLTGGTPRTLAETGALWHGAWNQAGLILFQPPASHQGTEQVSADGGVAKPAVKLDPDKGETGNAFPVFLSDGRRFLSTVNHSDGTRNIELSTLGSMTRKIILRDLPSAAILAPTPDGRTYLLYLRESSLMAREFDEKAESFRGSPFLLVDQIGAIANPPLRPTVGVSPAGVLAYQTSRETGAGTPRIAWFDRSGKSSGLLPATVAGAAPRLSPDGRFAALQIMGPNGMDIWLADLSRASSTRFTFAQGGRIHGSAVWSPDGRKLAYRLEGSGIFVKDANGTGAEQMILKSVTTAIPVSWSPDGRQVLIWKEPGLFLLPLEGGGPPVSVGPPSVANGLAAISPDGKYLAYVSNETNRSEVYVAQMPPGTGKWMVSISGGTQPRWRGDSKELFFVAPDARLMAADIDSKTGQGLIAGVPHLLFQAPVSARQAWQYDVTRDGQRFLMALPYYSQEESPITVVLNWWAGLQKQ